MNLIESLLDVLALIGIILTGGFLVFFLGDLLLSVLDPSYSSIFKRKKKNAEQAKEKEKEVVEEKQPEPVVESVQAIEEPAKVNDIEEAEKITFNDFDSLNEFDDQEALKEQQMLEGDTFSREDAMAQLRAEEEQFKKDQLQRAMEKEPVFEKVEETDEEDEDEFDLNSLFVEDEEDDLSGFNFDSEEETEETTEETVEETVEEVAEETVEEAELAQNVEIEEAVEEEQAEVVEETAEEEAAEQISLEEAIEAVEEKSSEEIEEKDRINRELIAQIEELTRQLEIAKEQANKPAEIVEIKTTANGMTKEECEEKLEQLKARLKANEKEFKQAKKEFLPLNKIRKTLENDKKKLRRKEAIVAKQKVVLYGVNNVVDIDQEKAQKLAEDLDLLDGLRLSVQHCEEVMKNNEERLPLLEKNYNILLQENTNIKADIATMEEYLKNFEQPEEVEDTETTDTETTEEN